ncbi:hypothetical protein BHE74_00009517 [Ensete ventricosum]|nr:hypothetical protein BHE74_00009517 [Ensete ventricosum]
MVGPEGQQYQDKGQLLRNGPAFSRGGVAAGEGDMGPDPMYQTQGHFNESRGGTVCNVDCATHEGAQGRDRGSVMDTQSPLTHVAPLDSSSGRTSRSLPSFAPSSSPFRFLASLTSAGRRSNECDVRGSGTTFDALIGKTRSFRRTGGGQPRCRIERTVRATMFWMLAVLYNRA